MSPEDIQAKSLPKAFSGYEKSAVERLIEQLKQQLVADQEKIIALEKTIAEIQHEVEERRSEEASIKGSVVLAQQVLSDAKSEAQILIRDSQESAEKDAKHIISEARQRADDILADLEHQESRLRWEIEKLHLQKKKFQREFEAILTKHLETLQTKPLETPEMSVRIHPQIDEPDVALGAE